MKKVFKAVARLICFVLVFVLLLATLSYLFVPQNLHRPFSFKNFTANAIVTEKENTIDVVILGDSEACYGFTPLQMWQEHGIAAFNCAMNVQVLDYTEKYLEEAYELQTPKVIIFEANMIFRKPNTGNYVENVALNTFSLFRTHNRWKTGEVSGDMKGYLFKDAVHPAKKTENMIPTDKAVPIPEENMENLNRICSFCKDNDIELIIVSTPSVKNWNYEKHNAVEKFASDNGIEYIDMNLLKDEVPIDWNTDTFDKGNHINNSGAKKVTGYLGKYLSENCNLPDHRGESEYENWDRELDKYLEMVSAGREN